MTMRSILPQQLMTGLFYSLTSLIIVILNKIVLTTYKFPSFRMLGLGQITSSIVVLAIARAFGVVNFPKMGWDTFWSVWPLPLAYIGDLLFGLGGTQNLSLPMLTGICDSLEDVCTVCLLMKVNAAQLHTLT